MAVNTDSAGSRTGINPSAAGGTPPDVAGGAAPDVTPAWGESLPAWTNTLVSYLASGQNWPESSERLLWQIATVNRELYEGLDTSIEPGVTAGGMILQAWTAPASKKFAEDFVQAYSEDSGVPALARQAAAYFQQADNFAREVQYSKISINVAFWIAVIAAYIALLAAFFSAGATTSALGPIAAAARSNIGRILQRLAAVAGRTPEGAVTGLAARGAATSGATAAGGAVQGLRTFLTGHTGREIIEELGEEGGIHLITEEIQKNKGTLAANDWRRFLASEVGAAGGAVIGMKAAPLLNRFSNSMPVLRRLNEFGGTDPGIMNAVKRFPARAVQTGLNNMVASPGGSILANTLVYGQNPLEALPDGEALLGAAAGGAGRTATIGPSDPRVAYAVMHPRATLDSAYAISAAADARLAGGDPPAGPGGPAATPGNQPDPVSGGTNLANAPAPDPATAAAAGNGGNGGNSGNGGNGGNGSNQSGAPAGNGQATGGAQNPQVAGAAPVTPVGTAGTPSATPASATPASGAAQPGSAPAASSPSASATPGTSGTPGTAGTPASPAQGTPSPGTQAASTPGGTGAGAQAAASGTGASGGSNTASAGPATPDNAAQPPAGTPGAQGSPSAPAAPAQGGTPAPAGAPEATSGNAQGGAPTSGNAQGAAPETGNAQGAAPTSGNAQGGAPTSGNAQSAAPGTAPAGAPATSGAPDPQTASASSGASSSSTQGAAPAPGTDPGAAPSPAQSGAGTAQSGAATPATPVAPVTGAAPANPAGTAPSQTPNRQAASGPATAAAPDPAAAPAATPDPAAAPAATPDPTAAPATPAATPDPAAPASAAAPDPAAAPGTAPDPGDASRLAGTALDEVLKIVAPDAMLLRNGDLRLTGPSGEIVHLSADFLGGVRGRLTLRAADRATPERLRAEAAAWLGAGIADVEGRNHTEGAVAALHRLTEAKPETNDAAVRVTLELMVDTAGQWDPARLGDGERRLMRDAADHLRNPADSYADLRSGTQARTAEEIARLAEALAPDPAASNAAGPSTGANPATSPELSELSGRVRELGESLAGAKTGLEERVKSHRDASRQAGKNIAEKLKEAEKAKKERDRGARKRHRDALAEVRVERDTGARHKRVAVRYQEARVRAEKARAAVAEASRALDALAAEQPAGRTAQRVAEVARLAREAADAVAAYDEAVKEALPPRDAMTGSVPADRLPHMTKLTGVVNRVLADHGVDQTFSPDELEHVLGSRFRRVTSDDGVVLQVGGATRGELRIRLRMGDLAEIVDPKITGSETMVGALPQGGRSVGTSGGRNRGMSFGLNVIALAKTLAGMFLEPHNGVRRFIEDVLDPFFRLEGSHSRSRSRGEGGNASEFALFGGVEDNRGESILLDIADVAWDVEFRPAGKTDWTATETVDARSGSEAEVIASAGDAKRLRVLVSHAYADHAPTETVQQSANHRDPNGRFPEHVVISMSGADERVDRTVELLGGSAVGDVARRQIRTFMAEDLPGRMYEAFNRPRGLSRTITDGGRPLGTVRVRSRIEWVPAPDGAPAPSMEPVGSATNKHHQERLRVQFSGTSGSTSSGRSRSTGVTVGGQGVLPGTSSLGGKAKLKGAFGYTRGRSRSTGANTGGTEIRPGVYRYSGDTQGYVAVVVHEITVHRFGEAEPRPTFVQRARALMRIPLTHAYDYGAEVDANAVARDDSGAPRRNPDGSPVFRDDRKSGPPPGRKAAPSGWQTGDPVRVRGAGPSEVQEFTPIDRAEVEAYLRERGMLAPLDADGNEIPSNDPLEWASHEANARELEEQLDERRVAAAYDQGAQDGIPMTFSRHRTGHASQTVTLVLTIDQHEVDSWEHTDAEVPVDLDIDSETSGLSSSESAGHDIRVEGGRGDTNADEEVAASRGGGYTYSRGLNAGATQGGTVNQVILGENNDLTAVARRKHTVRIADISSMADPITTQQGSSLLMTPAGMLPEDDSGNGPARTPTPHPTSRATLRRATLRAVDAGDLLQRVMPKLPRWVRSHPVIANMLASFLNVRSFMAQPDRLFGRAGMELAVRSRGTRRFRSPVWVSGRAGESEFVTAVDYVSGDINLTLGSQSASAGRTRGHAGDGSLSGGLSQAAPPKGGAGLSGSASRTTGLSAQELGIWGRERLVIETGKHYLFRMSADFDVTVGVPGAANAKVVSAPGRPVVYMVPERDALRLYAQGELRLPLDQVADVMERFLDGNLKIAPDVAAPLVGRYLSEQSAARDSGAPLPLLTADHTAERMVGKLTEAADGRYGGLGHTRNPGRRLARMIAYERARAAVLEKLLDDPDAKLSRRERAVAPEVATLPEHLRDAMGQTGVEELVLKRNGAETELFDEVLAAVEKKAPGALRKNRALWRSLFRDFSGKRWHGKLDSMLDPDGAPHTYTARVRGNDGRPLTVRVKMEFVGPPRLLNRTDEAGVIVQDYTYRDSSWSEAFNIAFGGGVSGEGAPAALKGAVGGDAKVQAGVNHSTSGTAGEQLTGIQRIASFNGMDRVAHAVKVTVEVDRPGRRGRGGRRPVVTELKGRMIRLVPSELVEAAKAAEASASPDTRPLAFPRTFFTESTRAAGLFQAAYDGLSRSDVLGRRGARRYRHDLEHALTAMARNANLRKMAGPNGHRIARFPVPGRPGRVVEVRVRAVPSQVRVLAAGRADVELGDVERFQATSGEAVESGQSLGASGGSGYGPSGVNVHGSAGRSTSERISEGGGNRDETSGFRKGDVTTVRTRIDYHITYELKSVVPGRPFYRRVEMLNAATGRADVTLFEEGMAEARREQEAPPVRGGGWRFGEPAVRHEPGRGWRARWGHGSGRPTTRFSLDELSRQSQSSRDFDPAAPYRSLAEHTLRRAPGIRRSGAPLLLTVDAGPEWQAARVNEARALARELGVPVHLEVREPGGVARPYLATPDGGLLSAALDPSGRRVVGVPDGGFAAALAALPPGLVAAANGRIDLRALHDRLLEGGDFTALVDRELTPPGVPAAPATGAAPHAGSQAQPVGGTYQGSVTSAPGGAPSAGGGSFSVTATQIPGTAFAVDIRAPHLADLTTAEVQTALRQAGPSALGRGVRDHRWSADGSTLIVELRNGDTHHFRVRIGRPRRRLSWDRSAGMPVVHFGPSSRLMARTKLRTGSAEDPSEMVLTSRPDPKMVARMVGHEVGHALQRKAAAEHRSGPAPFRRLLAAVDEITRHDYCMDARYDEYGHLADGWRSARTDDERAYYAHEMNGLRQLMLFEGHVPPVPPWEAGGAGRIGSGLGLDGLLNHSEPRVETRDEYWGRMRRLTNTTGWIPPEECTCPPGEPCVCGRRAQTPGGGTSPSPGSAPSAPPPGAASPSPEAPAPSVPVAADRADGSALAAAGRADGSTPVAAGRTDGRTG